MRCKYCGTGIESESLYCPKCGREVQIVPDYNPLDDVLAAQVKGSMVQSATTPHSTTGRITGADRTTGRVAVNERESRQRQAARKKERMRKKKQQRCVLIVAMVTIIIAIIGASVFIYQNSYGGLTKSGYSALEKSQYDKAIKKFDKAVSKNKAKADAYIGLSKVYLAKDDTASAETVFLDAIKKQPTNADIYKAACAFYVDTKQMEKVSPLIDACTSLSVVKALAAYNVKVPSYSLEEKTYDDVQELKLISKGNDIYYTIDGSEPTIASTPYKEAIQIGEGDTIVKSIAVNKKEIVSLVTEKAYKVVLPIENAPTVTPSTGQYKQAMQIVITVPEGYTAYYTLDGNEPTDQSTKYTEPIDMPEGADTYFSAVLIDSKGRKSAITERYYENKS